MRKHSLKLLISLVLCLALLAGCSVTETFEAESFIDDCARYVYVDNYGTLYELNIDFVDRCLDRFADSKFYEDMDEGERLEAAKQLFAALETYSFPPLDKGMVRNVVYNERTGEFTWDYAYRLEYTGRWVLPS